MELPREASGVYINGSQAHPGSHRAARMGEVSCSTFSSCAIPLFGSQSSNDI